MPTIVIHGLPQGMRGSSVLQHLALDELPTRLAAIAGLQIEPDFVTVTCPADLVVRQPHRLVAFVPDLYDFPARTTEVRAEAAQAILDCLVEFVTRYLRACESVQVYLGTHDRDRQGRASWPPPA